MYHVIGGHENPLGGKREKSKLIGERERKRKEREGEKEKKEGEEKRREREGKAKRGRESSASDYERIELKPDSLAFICGFVKVD